MILLYIIIILILIFGISIVYIMHTDMSSHRRLERIKNFDSIIATLQYHMEKSYDIVYKDQILVYSLEATKLDEKDFQLVAKEFTILVLTLLGPMLQKELSFLYGSEETLYFNITEYFNTRFDDDEIRKTAQDNLMNQE